MARNRMVKPEFWSSQSLHRVSLEARLLFIGIWNFSDDFGVCLDSNRKILGEIFPNDEQITERKIAKWRQELVNESLLLPVQYNGASYLIVRSWKEHQKVDHPSGRHWLEEETIEKLSTEYLSTREGFAQDSRSKEERGKKKEERESKRVFGEFENVTLTEKERLRLTEKLGSDERAKKAIEILSAYKKSKNKHYDSDYATFHTWVTSELEKREKNGNTSKNNGTGHANTGTRPTAEAGKYDRVTQRGKD